MATIPRIHLDLTDLATALVWHGSLTGIQRVQMGVAYAMIRTGQGTTFSILEGRWLCLDGIIGDTSGNGEEIVGAVRRAYVATSTRYAKARRSKAAFLLYRLHRKAMKERYVRAGLREMRKRIPSGHVLVSSGCYWQLPYLLDIYRRLIASGVVFVGVVYDIFPVQPLGNPPNWWPDIGHLMIRYLALPGRFVCISRFCAAQVLAEAGPDTYPMAADSLAAVPLAHEYPGVPRGSHPPLAGRLATLIAGRSYVLVVGATGNKNHGYAREVWAELRKSDPDLPWLVFAGRLGSTGVREADGEIWIDVPTDDELAQLYANTLFTFFPSLAEGWGLPVGESLWFGKLSVTSDVMSLPEAGGDLCLYLDPRNVASGIRACRRALDPVERAAMEARIAAAPLRTWNEVTDDMIGAIVALGGGERRGLTQETELPRL